MQIPILNGIYVDINARLRTSYPRNLVPIPKENGISKGYLAQPEGLVTFAQGPGIDRGGINWNGLLYRVMGDEFVYINKLGFVTQLGSVGNDGYPVSFAYSFTYLAIVSNRSLYYFDGLTLTKITDNNLGEPIDLIWLDNYFLITDGTTMVVPDLSDPHVINPLKYGSAEADPDPILALLKVRNEATVVGRYTIEVLQDIGGNFFPFQRINGAEVLRGAVGRKACCVFVEQVAFLGSGKNEPCAVYMAVNGISTKISTAEIDTIIKSYSEDDLLNCILEARLELNHAFLYIKLLDKTLVYDYTASQETHISTWYTLDSGLGPTASSYRCQFMVWCYNQWNFGDPSTPQIGTFSTDVSSHFGNEVSWEFGTIMVYNQGNGAIVHELELMALTGNIALGDNPTIWTSYSTDGETWSVDRPRSAGKVGDRGSRLNWLQLGNMRQFRIQKFKGTSKAHIAMLALEARLEPLND